MTLSVSERHFFSVLSISANSTQLLRVGVLNSEGSSNNCLSMVGYLETGFCQKEVKPTQPLQD